MIFFCRPRLRDLPGIAWSMFAFKVRSLFEERGASELLAFHLTRVIRERDAFAAELQRAEEENKRLRAQLSEQRGVHAN